MGSTRTKLTILASILLMAGQAAGAGPAAADGCPATTDQWEVTDLASPGARSTSTTWDRSPAPA